MKKASTKDKKLLVEKVENMMNMSQFRDSNMREKARACLSRATSFFDSGDEASVRYACLELRFAIEYIVYSQVESYKNELSDADLKKWTPKQLISAMRDLDPSVERTVRLAIGPQSTPDIPATHFQDLGECRRFTLKWANENHNALGNFLHAPTIDQIDKNQVASMEKILRKAQEVAETIQTILDSPLISVNFGEFIEFKCECEKDIKSRKGSFKIEAGIICTSCGAIWDEDEKDKNQFQLRQCNITCLGCKSTKQYPVHKIKIGSSIACSCGLRMGIAYGLVKIDENGSVIQVEQETPRTAPERI